jgi:hypothetical protein
MKFLLILGLAIVLVTSFLVTDLTSASAQSAKTYHCTYNNPCNYQVCGDHICAPGEFAQMKAQNNQAQMGNKTSVTPQVITSGNMATGPSTSTIIAGVATYEDVASDGTTVIVRTSHQISGQPMSLGIGFFGSNRNAIANQNYAITITQDNSIVLSKSNANANSGIDSLTTTPLSSSDPINIQVTLNGVGPSTADPSTWTGVKGEVLTFSEGQLETATTNMTATTSNMTVTTPTSNNAAVPEFGPVASAVLAIAVISVVVIATKTRVIPRF